MASFGRQILTRLRLIIGWVAELLHAMIVPIWGLRPLVASFGRQIPGWLRLIVDGGFQFSRAIVALIWGFGRWTVRIAGLLAIVYIFAFYVLDTPKDVAYRYSVPESEASKTQWRKANVLAPKRIEKKTGMFLDKGNDEITATASDPEIKTNKAFTCMLQKHVLYPPTNALKQPQPVFTRDRPISYNLAFLEFSEDGTPAEEGADGKKIMPENPGKDCSIERGGRSLPENCQLAAVIKHLSQNEKLQNFVMVFIHGWRHDASIGDDNVKDVRVYAAHLASFLDYRCHVMKRYCNAAVTAIYIGWRGARVNEQALTQVFEAWGAKLIGVSLGNFACISYFVRSQTSQ